MLLLAPYGRSAAINWGWKDKKLNFRPWWDAVWCKIFIGVQLKSILTMTGFNNKQNNTWTLGDMEFIFSCSHSISHSFAALTRSISMWTLEDKFHISGRPCIILYFSSTCGVNGAQINGGLNILDPAMAFVFIDLYWSAVNSRFHYRVKGSEHLSLIKKTFSMNLSLIGKTLRIFRTNGQVKKTPWPIETLSIFEFAKDGEI